MLDPIRFAELKAAGRLPSPSGSALRLIDLLGRDDVALSEIVSQIQHDPALTGRILKLANSAAFARPRPAVAVSADILMMIGLPAVRQLVLAFALIDASRTGPCRAFDYAAYWSHSVARAAAAQTLGSRPRLAPPAELFTLGLVADIGRLALASIEPVRYAKLLAELGARGAALAQAERAAFGFDHVELTEAMLRDWGLPNLFLDAVVLAQKEEEPHSATSPRLLHLALLLRLAQRLAWLTDQEDAARSNALPELIRLAQRLDYSAADFLALADDSLRAWQEWGSVLSVHTGTLTPFTVLQQDARLSAEQDSDQDARPLRVLVVDDDAALRRLLEHLLGKAGFAVHTAADGQQGLQEALAWHPDIVITDLMMPGSDGLELTRRLRSSDLGQGLYIMVLTSLNEEDKLAEAFGVGADDFIPKPLKPRTFLARLSAGARIVRLQKALAQRNLELAAALRQAELASFTDALTGLPNRRYIIERMEQECAAADRSGRPLSLLMFDIDHFKRINDTYGHAAGDVVLEQIARRVEKVKRLSDVVARFGGEEFVLLAIDTPLEAALTLADRLRAAITDEPIASAEGVIPVSVSIGVAEKAAGCHSLDLLLKAADRALYQAKRSGRNRVEFARCAGDEP